jgi:non-heme chloroperoxidase
MAAITTKDGTRLYDKDWGSGQPVVFSDGWRLSGQKKRSGVFSCPKK